MWNRWRGAGAADDEVTVLRAWVEQLTQDNMRLRLSQQRPSSPGQLADNLQDLGAELGSLAVTSADAGDEALHDLAQARAIRRSVTDVLVQLQVVAAQLERQLVGELPIAEIDRRVMDRPTHPGQRRSDRRAPVVGDSVPPAPHGPSNGDGHVPGGGRRANDVLAEMEHLLDGATQEPLRSSTGRTVG